MNMVICVLLTTFAIVRMLGSKKPEREKKKKKREKKNKKIGKKE